MPCSESQKKRLRGLGHQLKPIITVGNAGLSHSVLQEFDSSISHHELIKVRVRASDREGRDAIIAELEDKCAAELITRIGNVALFYRENPEARRIVLPA